ncbi:MAG: 1-acyl-sn-glycerol-3-phosphate acyltransferase [Bauldia sp.]|nr:MAG: 1-acyl-sn-glycerol-3-phosphate acyltransferase [Bauldia sp.]MBZ0229354.1 1-acyl-sn-glycerol-3-phosphate acyltransferase [Bauldia sp.]
MRSLRLGTIVVILGAMTFLLMPLQVLATRRGWPLAARLPWYWQRVARRVIGLRVEVVGAPAQPPLLIAANHLSWLDITLLGSVLPVSFIAKAEVAGWPVLGTLARLQRTVFIDRTRRAETARAAEAIARRVGDGDVMVLFAEGTTGDAARVLPFRSALIGAAAVAAGSSSITVQPVALAYTRIRGLPTGYADRPRLAWYGDMEFLPHFRHVVDLGAIDAVVAFGEPIVLGPDHDRKQVAEACFSAVRRMVETARGGAASPNGHPDPVFSPAAKGAKGTETSGAVAGIAATGREITNRVS